MEDVIAWINENKTAFQEELFELLRFPSVSADPSHAGDIKECALHLKYKFENMGFSADLMETGGHPLVYAEYKHPGNEKTYLVYGHYDVQPPDPLGEWEKDPFEPWVKDGNVVARGASDDKGQFLTHIISARAHLETRGAIPVNLKFVIEGEEEAPSGHLPGFVRKHKALLEADGVIISDTALYKDGIPAITYGLRGIAGAEIILRGPDKDLHSGGFGGAIANPVTELCRLIASFHNEKREVAVAGFYDDVKEPTDDERKRMELLGFDEGEFLAHTGAPSLIGEEGWSTLERIWARPTLELNGIYGGYQGEGGKTIVPSRAGAKITMRLVPDQDPEDILEKLKRHIEERVGNHVRMDFISQGGAKPVLLPVHGPMMEAGRKALEKAFGREPVFIRTGGSIPVVNAFKEDLGLDPLLVGFGREDDRIHSPNEKFSLSDFHKGIVASARLYFELR